MPPPKSSTPLASAPEPSSLPAMRRTHVELEIPPYLVARQGPGGRWLFHFQVPRRLRPEGWPGARRLPLDAAKRTGKGDFGEWSAAIADAAQLGRRMAAEKAPAAEEPAHPGSILWLIARIKDAATNPAWAEHSPATRTDYESDFRTLTAWSVELGHPHVAAIARSTLTAFINRFRSQPFKQAHVKTALRYVFQQAMAEDLVQANPIDRQMKLARRPRTQAQPWPDDVIEAVCARAAGLGRPSIAKALWTKWGRGLRTTDLLALSCPENVFFEDGAWWMSLDTSKTGKPVIVRLPAEAAALHEAELEELRRNDVAIGPRPFLVNEATGKRWTMRPWQKNVADLLADPSIGRPDLKPGWLRHTVMTDIDLIGIPTGQGAALVGHSPSSHEALKDRHYRIRTKALADKAATALDSARAERRNKERKSDAGV